MIYIYIYIYISAPVGGFATARDPVCVLSPRPDVSILQVEAAQRDRTEGRPP